MFPKQIKLFKEDESILEKKYKVGIIIQGEPRHENTFTKFVNRLILGIQGGKF